MKWNIDPSVKITIVLQDNPKIKFNLNNNNNLYKYVYGNIIDNWIEVLNHYVSFTFDS